MSIATKTVMAGALALACGALASAQEKPMAMAQLPAAVQKTVQDQVAQGATVRRLLTDQEGGQLEYEAELTVQGKHRDLSMDANGNVLEAEDAVALAEVPAAARKALSRAGKVVSVEAVSQHGKLVAYEAVVRKANGKRSEVRVTPEGKPAPEE
ncbi:MAG: hypothetical protein ACRD1E_06120 [Terriglobales bacterium]